MKKRKEITIGKVLSEGFSIGINNTSQLILAILLWVCTIWIPYINVGTTIALCSIPIALSRGGEISPLFIFDAKYRQYMGEFFTLAGLVLVTLSYALLFLIVPAVVIGIGWSLSIFIMLDKGTTPTKAMLLSNKATNGYKWIIFFVGIILALTAILFSIICGELGIIGVLLSIPILIITFCVQLGCTTVFYKKLFLESEYNDDVEDLNSEN